VPSQELPYLQRIYGFYGAADRLHHTHLPEERHDFGPNKRAAVYEFFAQVFGLERAQIDEERVTIESASNLQSFGTWEAMPRGAIHSWQELITQLQE
jgi:hypothetical protein